MPPPSQMLLLEAALFVTALSSSVSVPRLQDTATLVHLRPLRTVTLASRAVMPLAAGSKSNTRSVRLPVDDRAGGAGAPGYRRRPSDRDPPVAAASSPAPTSVSR